MGYIWLERESLIDKTFAFSPDLTEIKIDLAYMAIKFKARDPMSASCNILS